MDLTDLRQKILLELPVEELPNAGSIDKLSETICNSSNFWVQKFSNDGLVMINKKTDLEGWILEYTYSSICARKTSRIIKILPECGALLFNISGPTDLNILQSQMELNEITNYMTTLFIYSVGHPGGEYFSSPIMRQYSTEMNPIISALKIYSFQTTISINIQFLNRWHIN